MQSLTPVNDNFASGAVVALASGSGTVLGCNVGATVESHEPLVSMTATVWYLVTALSDGVLFVDTSYSDASTQVTVYANTNNTLAGLAPTSVYAEQCPVAYGYNCLRSAVVGGRSYAIQVGSYSSGGASSEYLYTK